MPFRSPQSPRSELFATVNIDYLGGSGEARHDLAKLKAAFEAGARVFLFSIPNNPTGSVYSKRKSARSPGLPPRSM